MRLLNTPYTLNPGTVVLVLFLGVQNPEAQSSYMWLLQSLEEGFQLAPNFTTLKPESLEDRTALTA